MASDLLPQFRESAGLNPDHVSLSVDLPPEPGVEEQDGAGLSAFYDIVVRVNQQIQNMKKWTTELNQIHNDLHCSTDDVQKKDLREESTRLHDSISKESQSVKANLDKMQELTAECKKKEQEMPAEIRIQENQHMLLRQEFVTALTNFQQVEQTNKDKYKETIKRRIRTKFSGSDRRLQDDEVEAMASDVIEKGTESAIFSSHKMSVATTVLEEVVEMRQDIHKIQKALTELHQMFLDMAVLVAEQDTMLNDIRDNLSKAVVYVNKGRGEIAKGREYQRRTRKRMCYLMICLMIIVGVALVVGLQFLN